MNLARWFSHPKLNLEAPQIAVPIVVPTLPETMRDFATPGAPIKTTTSFYNRNNNIGQPIVLGRRGPTF